MRIAFFSHSALRGGAEKALIELITGLQKQNVACLVLLPDQGPLQKDLAAAGIDYVISPNAWWMSPRRKPSVIKIFKSILKSVFNLFNLPKILKILRSWQPDIIYTNTVTIPTGAVCARILRLPHIWHIHELGKEHGIYYDWGTRTSYQFMRKNTDQFIAVSEAVKRKYAKFLSPEKIKVIYQSVTLSSGGDQNHFKRDNEYILSVVGYIYEGKGQADAVQALAYLKESRIPARLLLIGEEVDRTYSDTLRKIAKEKNIEDQVKFVGWVDDVDSIIKQSDVVLVCTRQEAFGRVVIEAMLAGTAVIGADSGAIPEFIKNGHNGLLYQRGEARDLADKIEYVLKNPAVKKDLESAAKSYAQEKFSREKYAEEVIELLKNVK